MESLRIRQCEGGVRSLARTAVPAPCTSFRGDFPRRFQGLSAAHARMVGDRKAHLFSRGPTVKAILCTRLGGPDDLVLTDIPTPVAGPGEALVRIEALGLNFYDTLIIAGKYQTKPALPFSPGG